MVQKRGHLVVQIVTMFPSRIIYLVCAAIAMTFAVLPLFWGRLFGYSIDIVIADLVFAALWAISFAGTVYFGKSSGYGRWWLALTAPIALYRIGWLIFAMIAWALHGFAP